MKYRKKMKEEEEEEANANTMNNAQWRRNQNYGGWEGKKGGYTKISRLH